MYRNDEAIQDIKPDANQNYSFFKLTRQYCGNTFCNLLVFHATKHTQQNISHHNQQVHATYCTLCSHERNIDQRKEAVELSSIEQVWLKTL